MRVALLFLGALVMSAGLLTLVGLEESVAVTVRLRVEEHWATAYDILVRPPDAAGALESRLDLVEPNALAGLKGGITRAQWEAIRELEDVEVAAPLANLGVGQVWVTIPWTALDAPAVYRVRITPHLDDGLGGITWTNTLYIRAGAARVPGDPEAGVDWTQAPDVPFHSILSILVPLAGIDPVEEAGLVGLDGAVVQGRYFEFWDAPLEESWSPRLTHGGQAWRIPVLVSTVPYVRPSLTVDIRKLEELPGDPSPDTLRRLGGREYLDRLSGTAYFSGAVGPEEVHGLLLEEFGRPSAARVMSVAAFGLLEPPDPPQFEPLEDPDLQRTWPTLLEAVPLGAVAWNEPLPVGTIRWRPQHWMMTALDAQGLTMVSLRVLGHFDPARLDVAMDPLNEVPMDTYRPPTAPVRLDPTKRPLEPPPTLLPVHPAYGLLTAPPVLQTTIDAAEAVLGEAPIAAVRVRVRGAGAAGERSWLKLQQVADEIARRTGLRAEVTAGSSPRRVLVHVPGWSGDAELSAFGHAAGRTVPLEVPATGYVELPWVQKGAGIVLLREAHLSQVALLVTVLAVGAAFALATASTSAEGWRREMGLLAALGLRPGGIVAFLVGEAAAFGAAAAGAALGLAWLRAGPGGLTPLEVAVLAGLPPLVLGLGAFFAARGLGRRPAAAVLREAGTDAAVPRVPVGPSAAGLALAGLVRRPWRTLVAALALGFPAALVAVLGTIHLRLGGYFALTWLGMDISLRVQPAHYTAAALALGLAALAAVDAIGVKVQDRAAEWSLLEALGVPPQALALAVVLEGAGLGLAGGMFGAALATAALWAATGALPAGLWLVWALAGAVPAAVGALAALGPAWAAVRLPPARGVRAG